MTRINQFLTYLVHGPSAVCIGHTLKHLPEYKLILLPTPTSSPPSLFSSHLLPIFPSLIPTAGLNTTSSHPLLSIASVINSTGESLGINSYTQFYNKYNFKKNYIKIIV
jgi:hypothetical protein